ncbi:CRP/FNR family transcriptional regulator, anaerobic regulatory protein [Chitinophaga sp. CF118]|uniref:Crp/Fnr family transcriptional regulator n=1 Tax=Chitinophaga sp. CF118 TaxID=1884367 RepID=UPI0008EB1142|nr:Crp/Fnr family transcriptional regulator [Chitinophaga sp. CF118]SFD79039.1 CRP/FNR family transcriptional regulator, anaerobic regulatory protein [Chitinophaga sp. CF118]
MEATQINEYLNKYFPQFEEGLREQVAKNCTVKSVLKGETMIQTGQYFRSTVLVIEGRLKLYREGEEGGEFFMYYLEPGNACALSMVCAQKQLTSGVMAKALEDSIVLMIPVAMMESLMQEFKSWYAFVVETYRLRFEELLVIIDSIAFKSMDERLVSYLENQQNKLNSNQLFITHNEIATDLHSSREVISRLLKKLEQQQKVRLFRNYIELL